MDDIPDTREGSVSQADEVVRLVRHVLGSAVIGAYLNGSAVLGGLRPADLPLGEYRVRRNQP